MKKLMLIFAGALFFGASAMSQERDTATITPATPPQLEQTPRQGSQNLRDLTTIKMSEIPSGLKETLQSPAYKGWDSSTSTIYKNKSGDLYIVEIFDGTMSKTFRFDQNGKPIKE